MEHPWIEFRGVKSSDLNLFVEKLPARPGPKKRVTSDTVIGRSGTLHTDGGAWEEVQLQVALNLAGQCGRGEAYHWLSGSGDLIFSDDPDKCYRATVIDAVADNRRRVFGQDWDTIMVKFFCEPFRYEADPARVSLPSGGTVTGLGSADADPWIFLTGSGDVTLTIGDAEVLFEDLTAGQTVLLDCEAKMCVLVDSAETQIAVTLGTGEWPRLAADGGTTVSVSGTVTGLIIQPNWRWL